MASIQTSEDLEIWQKTRLLSQKTYPYTFADEMTKMITSFISYLNQSAIKGQKFKNR